MKIAICDDDNNYRVIVKDLIKLHNETNLNITIKEFCCGEDVITDYNSGIKYDVIFLDIEMKEMDGIQTALKIRNSDTDAIIVFITNHTKFVYQSFKTEAFDYLIKPIEKKKFDEIFLRVLKKYQKQHCKITLKANESISTIDIKEIVYIESNNHHIVFHLRKEIIECTGKLQEYENKLVDHNFFRCHKSILINPAFIKIINNYDIITTFNEKVHISRRKKQFCLSCYNKYLSRYHV
jgi:two-component system response regulator LytT